MNLSDQLDSAWATLEAGDEREALLRSLTDLELSGNVRLGIDENNARELHFEIPNDVDVSGVPKVHGVRVFVRAFRGTVKPQRFLVLRCGDPGSHRVFARFAADVLEQVTDAASTTDKVMEVLAAWREMFRRVATESESYLRGVFGELHELECIARYSPIGIASWQGPNKQPRDFELGRLGLEVKSSRWLASAVEVHGLQQLWPTPFELLVLAVKHVATMASGQTISDLADTLVGLGVDATILWDKLEQLDLPKSRLIESPGSRFEVKNTRYYAVTDTSHVLTPESLKAEVLPAAVSKLSYELDLAALSVCPPDVIEKLHRGLAGQ